MSIGEKLLNMGINIKILLWRGIKLQYKLNRQKESDNKIKDFMVNFMRDTEKSKMNKWRCIFNFLIFF